MTPPGAPPPRDAFGTQKLTLVDRFGVWLSRRAISRQLPPRNGLDILNLGCGFQAKNLIALKPRVRRAVGIDFRVSDTAKRVEGMEFIEGPLERIRRNSAPSRSTRS